MINTVDCRMHDAKARRLKRYDSDPYRVQNTHGNLKFGDFYNRIRAGEELRLFVWIPKFREVTKEAIMSDLQHMPFMRNQFLNISLGHYRPSQQTVMFMRKLQASPLLYIGAKGSITELHRDGPHTGFWMFQFEGAKKVELFPNNWRSLAHLPVDCGYFKRPIPDAELDKQRAMVECFHGTILPGDMLYVPGEWWHRFEYPEMSFSFTVRGHGFQPTKLQKLKESIFNSYKYVVWRESHSWRHVILIETIRLNVYFLVRLLRSFFKALEIVHISLFYLSNLNGVSTSLSRLRFGIV